MKTAKAAKNARPLLLLIGKDWIATTGRRQSLCECQGVALYFLASLAILAVHLFSLS